jgi:hypothetical protein
MNELQRLSTTHLRIHHQQQRLHKFLESSTVTCRSQVARFDGIYIREKAFALQRLNENKMRSKSIDRSTYQQDVAADHQTDVARYAAGKIDKCGPITRKSGHGKHLRPDYNNKAHSHSR